MRRIFLLFATASLLFACDKTENEQDIIDVFFGSGTEANNPRPDVYDQMAVTENVYLQEFSSAAASDWQSGKGLNDGTYSVSAGNYVITASNKGPTGVWKDLPTSLSSGNYQIDTYVKHVSFGSNAEQAILYGVTNGGNSFYFFGCKPATTTSIIIGKDEANWYEKQRDLHLDSYHLYTVRKYNRKLYFFIDKSYTYSCTDFNFQNYGFYVGKSGTMNVDYVRVSYIESAKE